MIHYLIKSNKNGVLSQWFYIGLGSLLGVTLMFIYYSSAYHIQWKHLLKPHGKTDDEKIAFIANKHPNLPIDYWVKMRNTEWQHYYKNSSCAMFPNLLELNINQIHWQSLYTSNATIQLFSAFYDTREVTPGKSIRVLSMIDRNKIFFKLYCQIWYNGKQEPLIVEVERINYIQHAYWQMHPDGKLGPYLLECNLPNTQDTSPPVVVSIVANPCDRAKNMLKVVYDVAVEPENIAVCVKGLDFLHVDISARLVEWLELTFMFGANKVFFYELGIHPNVRKVINYYQRLGKVDHRQLTLPEGQMNIPILQHMYIVTSDEQQWLNELIPYNDCFYRNIYKYKYVLLMDTDEMIVPVNNDHWIDLLDRWKFSKLNDFNTYASFNVRNFDFIDDMTSFSQFSDDIPEYMHMLQYVNRARNISKPRTNVRSFFDTRYVLTCHKNLPIDYSNRSIFTFDIPTEAARKHHYTRVCPEEEDCKIYMKDVVTDTTIRKYKNELVKRVQNAMYDIGLTNTEA